jgi:hypothetical protein
MGDRSTYLRVAAIGVQVAAVAGCAVLGWSALHSTPAATRVNVQHAAPAPVAAVAPVLGALGGGSSGHPRGAAAAPSLMDMVTRINQDDARLYQGQAQTIRLLGSATRAYLERHVVPLLLAAARAGLR